MPEFGGLLAEAYVQLRASGSVLQKDIDEQIAAVGDPAAAAMDEAMVKTKQSVADASKQIGDDLEGGAARGGRAFRAAGEDIGASMEAPAGLARLSIDGAADDIERRATSISDAFTRSGTGIGDVFAATGPKIAGDMGKATEDMEASGSRLGGVFTSMTASVGGALARVGEKIEGLGIPFGGVFTKAGESMKDVEGGAGSLGGALASVGKVATVAVAGGFVVAAAAGLDMGAKFQDASTNLQASGNLSAKAAKSIGDAFLATGTSAHFSATTITNAYAPVAAQLAGVQGHALSTKQAMDVMNAAMELADATGDSLSSDTANLGKVMQAYGITAAGAAGATNVLYTTSRLTDVPIANIATAVDKMHLRLGAATPSLSDVGSLMGDLAEHGVVGQRGITTVTTALSGLVAPSTKTAGVLAQLGISLTDSSGKFIGMGPAIADIHDKLGELPKTSNAAAEGLQIAADKAKVSQLALEKSTPAIVAQKAALGDQILSLTTSSKALTQTSAMTALFGTQASALTGVISAGSAGFDKASSAINKAGSVTSAADIRNQTFHATMERLEATVEDLGIKFGLVLMPILMKLMSVIEDMIVWFTKHKVIAEALALVIGGVLVVAIGAFVLGVIAANAAMIATVLIAGEILIPLVALGVGIYELVTHWSEVWNEIKQITSDVVDAVTGFIKQWWPVLLALTTGGLSLIVAYVIDHWTQLKADTVAIFDDVVDFIKQWWPELFAISTGGISLIVGLVIQHWSQIQAFTKQVFTDIQNFFVTVWNFLVNVVTGAINAIHTVIVAVWNAVQSFLTGAWTTLENVASTLWTAITGAITAEWTRLSTNIQNDWAAISSFLTGAWSAFITTASGWWTRIVSGITGSWDTLKADATALWDGITTSFITGIDKVIGFINRDFLDPLNSVFGHFGVPHLGIPVIAAAGGAAMNPGRVGAGFVTNGPTFLVGEGNQSHPEVVVPTDPAHRDNAKKLMAYAGSIMGLAAGGIAPGPGGIKGGGAPVVTGTGQGLIADIRDWTADAVDPIINRVAGAIEAVVGGVVPSFIGSSAEGYLKSAVTTIESFIRGHQPKPPAGGGVSGPVGVIPTGGQLALIVQALTLAGQATNAANEADVNTIVTFESGWYPGAQNNSDSNAAAGHPSKGLMQTIQGTFDAYALPGYNSNIFDPISNLVAGIRYAVARYGSLGNVPGIVSMAGGGGYVGYETGGMLGGIPIGVYDGGGFLPQNWSIAGNFTGAPEPVGTPTGGGINIPISIIVSADVSDATIARMRAEMHAQIVASLGQFVDASISDDRAFR